MPPQPRLTDGLVVLRPWRDDDIEAARLAHDEEIAQWFGFPVVTPSRGQQGEAIQRWREQYADGRRTVNFLIESEGMPAGNVEVRQLGDGVGDLSWALYPRHRGRGIATRAVGLMIRYAFDELGLVRLTAHVDPGNLTSLRVASRSGLRREGLLRQRETTGGRRSDHVVLARLVDDPDPRTAEGFRALLNAGLPRKRAISQLLVRDQKNRVLLCQLTYKKDWDLPGGVVEVGESPALAVSRECLEELGLELAAQDLLAVDWLPSWSGWDDAVCLVFDGGVHEPAIVERIVPEAREIRTAEFCDLDQVRERCADFTARRIESALEVAERTATGGAAYLEGGSARDR